MSDFKLSTRSEQRAEGVDPRLLEIAHLAIQITLMDFGIPEDGGLRTASRQFILYNLNRSKADGYTSKSNHQAKEDGLGKALDIYAYIDGAASWKRSHLAMVACALFQAAGILGYKIRWGGLWIGKSIEVEDGTPYGWDCPHIELIED